MRILVLGAGVVGLTAAVRLQEAGHEVTIWAAELPGTTTSSAAGAVWYPTAQEPRRVSRAWAQRSHAVFSELQGVATSGVCFRPARRFFHRPMGRPWWWRLAPEFRLLGAGDVPAGYRCGYSFLIPIADMSQYYLHYLPERFETAGGCLQEKRVRRLDDALQAERIVVNATGLGARELVGDRELYPIRGQVSRLARRPSPAAPVILDWDHPEGIVYIVPREHDCLIGGTSQKDCWSINPDDEDRTAMLRRAASWLPELEKKDTLESYVGLRPGRASFRCETEAPSPERRILHHYGHGGAGVTLSWGCADEVLRQVRAFEAGLG